MGKMDIVVFQELFLSELLTSRYCFKPLADEILFSTFDACVFLLLGQKNWEGGIGPPSLPLVTALKYLTKRIQTYKQSPGNIASQRDNASPKQKFTCKIKRTIS